jgi:hypothetical protein
LKFVTATPQEESTPVPSTIAAISLAVFQEDSTQPVAKLV